MNVTDVLLKNGANINIVDFQLRTALHLAAEKGKIQMFCKKFIWKQINNKQHSI